MSSKKKLPVEGCICHTLPEWLPDFPGHSPKCPWFMVPDETPDVAFQSPNSHPSHRKSLLGPYPLWVDNSRASEMLMYLDPFSIQFCCCMKLPYKEYQGDQYVTLIKDVTEFGFSSHPLTLKVFDPGHFIPQIISNLSH